MSSSIVLGIDVGCSTCSVALYRNGTVDQVANEQGSRMTPAVVAFTDIETLLGEPARSQLVRNPANTVVDGLQLLGRDFDDDAFQKAKTAWPFHLSRGKDGSPLVDVTLKGEHKSIAAPRVLSMLLARLRADADGLVGESVKEAVIATPAHFDERQLAALKEAAQMGGIKVKMMLSAPLCAALLYGQTVGLTPSSMPVMGRTEPSGQQLLVVDVGGSSSAASVVERVHVAPRKTADGGDPSCDEGKQGDKYAWTEGECYHVRSTIQEAGLGGRQIDEKLRAHVLKEIRRRQRADLSTNARAMARLLAACEVAKHSLTASSQATVTVEAEGVDYFASVSRAALEDLAAPLAARVVELATAALSKAHLEPSRVSTILLAGGGSRMPRVQAAMSALCANAQVCFGGTSEETVSQGAAYGGAMLRPLALPDVPGDRRGQLQTRHRIPYALGIRTSTGTPFRLAESGSVIPLCRTASFAPPSVATALLVELVEIQSEATDVMEATLRSVARLAVRDVPIGIQSLVLTLEIDAEGQLELSCEAAREASDIEQDGQGDDAARGLEHKLLLGSVRA